MNYFDKINKIIELLINENKKYGIDKRAQYWKMGTSYFTMFDRLLKKIENVDITHPIITKVNNNNLTTEGKNKSFQFFINNINITPCKVRGYVSDSAIHQYMRSICAFGLGIVEIKYKHFKDFVINNGQIKLVHNIIQLLNKNNRIFLIKKVIVDSFFSNIQDMRNISYSIILEFLFFKNFDFKNLSYKNRLFSWKKSHGKRNDKKEKFGNLVDDLEKIKNDVYSQGTIATYKEITKCLDTNYNSIEEFINDIWIQYQQKSNNDICKENINYQINELNKKSLISSNRTKFKQNIFEDRKQKGLIKNKNDLYTDIVDLNGSQDFLVSKFNESEAAHIYDVHKIKNVVLNTKDTSNKNDYIEYVSNPNNGLMMNHDYHKSFDRGQWTFDANGEMIISNENQKYLFDIKGLKRIKINPLVLNEDMKKFLKMR